MRVGMIGLDTSHVIAFTEIFQDHRDHADLSEIEIVAGFPGGTDIPLSRERVADYSAQLSRKGVEIVSSIPALLEQVDAVMLESVDGNAHLEQVIPVFESGLPVFVDKPLAGSFADAVEIARLATLHAVPCFSSSSIRYSPKLDDVCASLRSIQGATTWSPCHTHENIPDLFFYGIHGIEGLFRLMGSGCESVQRVSREQIELVVGTWKDGRIGTYHGLRTSESIFGATAFAAERVLSVDIEIPYRELCVQIAKFFRTNIPPVPLPETMQIFKFMQAAEESKRQGGATVALDQIQ